MKREDWPVLAIILEAVDILAGLGYCGLQIFYSLNYHIAWYKTVVNLLVVILIYVGLTLLAIYPENLNRLPQEVCQGKVRSLSLWMIRVEKLLFLLSLLVPCICDVAAIHLPALYNVAAILLMVIVAVFFEIRILEELKKRK